MKLLKKLFHGRMGMVFCCAFAMLTIAVTAISTAAWFTISRSQTIETGLVTGSGEIEVKDIDGYKVQQERKQNGYINYGNTTVTKMNYNTSDFSTENSDQEGADTNFDIPTNGIGFYFIPAVNDSFKYSNGTKMNSFSSSDSALMYLDNQTITAGSYRIREYGFTVNEGVTETVSRKVSIADANSTSASLTASEDNGDITITLGAGIGSAICKVWFDSNISKIGFDVISTSPVAPNLFGGARTHNLYGSETVYFDTGSVGGWFDNGGAKAYVHLWGGSGSTDMLMTKVPGSTTTWYCDINVSTYPNVIFYRYNTNDVSHAWNKTVDLAFETGTSSKRLYKITSDSDPWLYGEWQNYEDYSPTYTMKVNGTTSYSMQINGDNTAECMLASSITLNRGDVLSFTANGSAVSVNPKDTAYNLTDNGDNVTVKGKVVSNVYLNLAAKTVWIADSYSIFIGSTEYALPTDAGGGNEKSGTVSGTKDDTVDVHYNGATITGWFANTSSGNNVSTGKKIVTTFTNEGAYYNFNTKSLWIEGNKIYSAYDGSTSRGNMVFCGEGTFSGWYMISNVTVTAGNAAGIKYTTTNGSGQTTTTTCSIAYYSDSTNNLNSSTKKYLKSGTVTIYYNTSNNNLFVTPVYSVTIGSVNKEATFVSGSTYRTAATFDLTAQDAYTVKVFRNTTEITSNYSASSNANNNLEGSGSGMRTICYSTSANVYADVYTDSTSLWVSGYHDPVYTIKLTRGGDTSTLSTSTASTVVSATTNVVAGDKLTFIKNKTNKTPTATSTSNNNVSQSGSTYTIISSASNATISWDYSAETVFVTGRELRYRFCNTFYQGNKLFTNTPYAYAYDAGGTHYNEAWPGVPMTEDSDGTYYIDISFDYEYTTLIINDPNGTHRQTANLTLSGNEEKYYWIKDSATATVPGHDTLYYTTGDWYDDPPSSANAKTYYFHDKYLSTHFGGSAPTMYASAWASGKISAGGAIYPGETMRTVIDGSLYSITVGGIYTGILFASSSQKTLDYNVGSVAGGSVFIAAQNLDSTYSRVQGTWGVQYSESGFGSAKIHIYGSGGAERLKAYNSDGSLSNEDLPKDLRNGDTGHNYYIYEEGIYAKAGETFNITYSGTDLPNLSGSGTLNGNNFVSEVDSQDSNKRHITTSKYPFLTFANGGTITNSSSGTVTFAADGRYNFYVNHEGRISVAMVPIYGNGFYVIPYVSTTEGFTNAMKMNTVSSTSGSYTGYKVDAREGNQRFYFRSYLNAVDTIYKTINIDPRLNTTEKTYVTANSDGVVTFQNQYAGYINIEISNKQVYIKPYEISEFFRLDPLDVSKTTSQATIKSQNTSLVLGVKFTTDSDRALDLYLDVGNNFVDGSGKRYVGCSVYMVKADGSGAGLSTPWETMRASRYSLSTASTIKFGQSTSGTGTYYAYILIDYYWDSTISSYYSLRSLSSQTISFDLHTEKKTVASSSASSATA